MAIEIKTPRGQIIQTTTKSGKVKAELTWNRNFAPTRTAKFSRAQKFVDSEVLRYCSALVPFQTGMLDRSGKLGTVIGSGLVQYIAPYAAKQYYDTAESRPYDSKRPLKNNLLFHFESQMLIKNPPVFNILMGFL